VFIIYRQGYRGGMDCGLADCGLAVYTSLFTGLRTGN